MPFIPQATSSLPLAALQVENYWGTGAVDTITPQSWYIDSAPPTFTFVELDAAGGTTLFDPSKLTSEEAALAVHRDYGQLLGWIAVPPTLVVQALNSGAGAFYVKLHSRYYLASLAFHNIRINEDPYVVVGIYTGRPDVTALQ